MYLCMCIQVQDTLSIDINGYMLWSVENYSFVFHRAWTLNDRDVAANKTDKQHNDAGNGNKTWSTVLTGYVMSEYTGTLATFWCLFLINYFHLGSIFYWCSLLSLRAQLMCPHNSNDRECNFHYWENYQNFIHSNFNKNMFVLNGPMQSIISINLTFDADPGTITSNFHKTYLWNCVLIATVLLHIFL